MKKITLKELYNNKKNSFTLLSIILSILILYFHSYPLFFGANTTNRDIVTKIIYGENLGSIVVAMFFIISGYMITYSIQRSKNIFEYIKKRIVKIYPTLILCLLICALIVCPLISDIPALQFIKTPSLYYKYIIDNVLLYRNTVYSVSTIFANNPYQYAINGSIWTLKHQFFMYILIIPIFYYFIKKKNYNRYIFLFIPILIITMISFSGFYDGFLQKIALHFNKIGILVEGNQLIRLTYYFLSGVFMNIYSEKIYYSKKTLVLSFIIFILTFRTKIFTYACLILIPYITVFLGSLKTKVKIIDISYQIFVFGFPVQQTIIYFLNGKINITLYIILSILITAIISIIIYYILKILKKINNVISSKIIFKS